jgi:hypothetical protein
MRRVVVGLFLVILVTMVGCASKPYVIQTKDGKKYVSPSEPDYDKAKQAYEFTDPEGNKWVINRDQILSIEQPAKVTP